MNCLNFFIIVLYVLFSNYGTALAWDNIDLELFDLVEEVRTNFYEVLGVPQVSSFFLYKHCFNNFNWLSNNYHLYM
jgi:hypothetical protein